MTYDTFAMPLNQEITSQGYCYQALIYFYLTKQGVKDEVKFFDEQADIIAKAALPPVTTTPEKEREKRLKMQDELEQSQKDIEEKEDSEEYDSLEIELRRSIRTVEVMGCIIKNRAGSLEKTKLEEIFVEAMNVHLRILSSFFDIIKNKDGQKSIIDFLSERLEKIIEKSEKGKKKLSEERLIEISRIIFWNINFKILRGAVLFIRLFTR